MKIIVAILLFSIIIIFHELGHFWLAKANGVRVNEFSLGLGPTLVGFTKGETKYSLKLLPFGGACMMEGEDEDSDDSRAFGKKNVWARISIVAAGPVFNFIMAFICAVILLGCNGYDLPVLADVMENSAAADAGMQAGDEIIAIGNRKIHFFRDISAYTQFHQGETVTVTYERDGERISTELTPRYNEENGYYMYGFMGGTVRGDGNIFQTMKYGVYEIRYWINVTLNSLRMLLTGGANISDMMGPVGIVSMIGDGYEESVSYGYFAAFLQMLYMTVFLSANLGIMNLLPLPALDGGRLLFLIIEAIRGKRVDPEKEGMVHFVGMMLLFALMIIVVFNDVRRLM